MNQFEKYEPVWKIWTSLKKFELEINLNHNMYMWVEFSAVFALLWQFFCVLQFPPSTKTNIPTFQFDQDIGLRLMWLPLKVL